MIITKEMLNQKVPKDIIPTRLDSATDLLTYTKDGLLLYNIKPDTWNELYPFFQQENKFTIDSYKIDSDDITYQELIDLYNNIYNEDYVLKRGFNEEGRKKVLVDEFNKTFNVTGTVIGDKLDSHYELKYSKSKNVYTLYYLEGYVVSKIDDVDKLLSQKVYQQELLKLDKIPIPEKINGVKIVDSVSFVNDEKIKDLLESNVLN